MTAPINVRLERPTDGIKDKDWEQQAQEWKKLNKEVGGHPEFYPLTIKFGYMLGIIHGIYECVACLLHETQFARQTSYIPAYGLFASGIELIGRCVGGESNPRTSTLPVGFKWLSDPRFSHYEDIQLSKSLISTSQQEYDINQLANLRHFAAHGQATSAFPVIDYEIISRLHPLLRDGLEYYWAGLVKHEDPCNKLASANVIGLRGYPVKSAWLRLQGDEQIGPQSITTLLDRFRDGFVI